MAITIGRRRFMTMLGGATRGRSRRAQSSSVPVISCLSSDSSGAQAVRVAAFRRGPGEMGYAEGQNVAFEFRWAEEQRDRLPQLAAELVAVRAAVIIASDGPATARPALTANRVDESRQTTPVFVAWSG
jgi:putative ABC transport system substrate-binding protein